MSGYAAIRGVAVGLLIVLGPSASIGGEILDHLKAGMHKHLKENFHTKADKVENCPPYDLMKIAHLVDILEEGIQDAGTVVIKQPDIWGQARMTKYRREFEKEMAGELGKFATVLSARVARTDQASFQSATTLVRGPGSTRRGGR